MKRDELRTPSESHAVSADGCAIYFSDHGTLVGVGTPLCAKLDDKYPGTTDLICRSNDGGESMAFIQ